MQEAVLAFGIKWQKHQVIQGTNHAATLIGYVGKSISTKYGSSSSDAFISDVIKFINNVGNYNYKLNAMDYSYVTKELIRRQSGIRKIR